MSFTTRPELRGTFGMVTSTHWLASQSGMAVLERGGNAFDAAVATGFVLQVVEPHLNGPGGEVPAVFWSAERGEPLALCGQGVAPAAATIERFHELGHELIPGTGALAACVPGSFGGWLLLLRDFGTWRLGDVLELAIGYAEHGYPLHERIRATIALHEELIASCPGSRDLYLPVPAAGALFRNPALAATYRRIVEESRGGSREEEIEKARLTGVGKTSLIRYLCRNRGIPFLRVECSQTFEDTLREALSLLVDSEEADRVIRTSTDAEVGASLWTILSAKLKATSGEDVRRVKIPRSLAGVLAEALALNKTQVLFLDNFENLLHEQADEARRRLVELIKLLSDRSIDAENDVKLVVAGIPAASERLVSVDDATARRTAQVEVPRMPPGELDQILMRGGAKLGIEFEGLARDQIVQYSDGFPYYTHLYGLHCARHVLRRKGSRVDLQDFEQALDAIISDCELSLKQTYNKAVETTGEVKVRKTILEAMAMVNDLEMPFGRIRTEFIKLHSPRYNFESKMNFLSPAIKQLKDDNVLVDRGLPKSPNNLYRFSNPLLRGYVRLQRLREQKPQLPGV